MKALFACDRGTFLEIAGACLISSNSLTFQPVRAEIGLPKMGKPDVVSLNVQALPARNHPRPLILS